MVQSNPNEYKSKYEQIITNWFSMVTDLFDPIFPGWFIHDGSNDKSLGPVSQGTGSPIFHTRGATGNWTPVGILENSYRSLHARSLRVACSHIGCTLQAPNLVGNNPSTFPGWFLRMFRVTPFMLTTRAWESTLVAGTFHFILICLYHYLFAEFFPWWWL